MKHMILILILTITNQVFAAMAPLKPIDIYKRCYIRMTRMLPVETDTLYLKVKNNQVAAKDACIQLFEHAQFGEDGSLKQRTTEAKAIVKTFHELHRSWYQSKARSLDAPTFIINDLEEDSLYFTRAAFLPTAPFSSVVTLNSGVKGIRDQISYPNEENDFLAQTMVSIGSTKPYAGALDPVIAYESYTYDGKKIIKTGLRGHVVPHTSVVEVGTLTGVRASSPITVPSFRPAAAPVDSPQSIINIMNNFVINKHFGGGVIGSQAFITKNVNLIGATLPFEYTHINRRLTSRVFEDLLCHQMPSLEDADVQAEVLPASPHPFQQTTSCMRCHSSIDGMAFGYRNLISFTLSPPATNQDVGLRTMGITGLEPSATATTFAAKIPEGRLHYRELITKKRRDLKFNSLAQLGEQISTGMDLYTCAAKRYYQFFTGVDVNLHEKATKPLDKLHQDAVIQMGKDLKSGQKIRNLIYQIFSSEAFQAPNYLTERSQ